VEDEDDIDPQTLVDVMDMFRASYYAQRGSAAKVHIRTFGALAGRVGAGDIRDLTFRWAWNLCDVLAAVRVGFPAFAPPVFRATTLDDIRKVPGNSSRETGKTLITSLALASRTYRAYSAQRWPFWFKI
jgi:hypothetical protein